MITIANLSLSFGTRTLFDSINCSIDITKKIGLIGRNGAGKSTLLKIISGLLKPDEGKVIIQRGINIAYLPQELVLNSQKLVFQEACTGQEKSYILKARFETLDALCAAGKATAIDLEEYSNIQEQLNSINFHDYELKAHEVLNGLGFTESQKNQSVSTLSVGWKMRLVLARLLLTQADFYLFDEPTNHLDIVTKDWFYNFLRSSCPGFLLVSHDRYFLDHACDRLIELDQAHAQYYEGNFTYYIQKKEEERIAILKAYEQQKREIAQKQATIDRFKASASKAAMAQSMIKKLEKIELIEPAPVLPTINVKFPPLNSSGSMVLQAEQVAFGFEDKKLFNNVSFTIHRGNKIALVAANGVGKTTLLNVLIGIYKQQKGSITIGNGVELAVFEQDQANSLDTHKTIFEEVNHYATNSSEAQVRAFLGSLLFSGDDIHKKIGVLSGGEKNRVALAKILIKKANFIILDEPTNHLDLYAKEVLVEALIQYKGTILFVCHDRDIMDRVANRIFELSPDGIADYQGNYESYLSQKQYRRMQPDHKQSNECKPEEKASKISNQKIKKELHSLEARINRNQQTYDKLLIELATHNYGSEQYCNLQKKINALQKSINDDTTYWEQLTETVC